MTDPARLLAVDAFITRWRAASGSERANYQLFVGELCDLLGVPKPDPARDDTLENAYVFERRVQFAHGDGSVSHGFIDCYQRGRFVLEAFTGRGPWKRRIPQILDALAALGRARVVNGLWTLG